MSSIECLIERVRAEYREMPGLSLTVEQVSRLMGVHLSLCQRVLHALVVDGVLYHSRSGHYTSAPPIRDRR